MTDDDTDQAENQTLPEARQQLADDQEAYGRATEHLDELRRKADNGDRDVTAEDLVHAQAQVEVTQRRIKGSKNNLKEVAQRVVNETAQEILEEARADLNENPGEFKETRQAVNDAYHKHRDAITEQNRRVSGHRRKLREAIPANLPDGVDRNAVIRAGKEIERYEVEYKTFSWEEGEDVYVFHDGKRRERAGRVTLARS